MKNLYAKLLKIQGSLKPIPKEEENPHFKSSYYDINALLAQLKPLLTANGLVLLQPIESDEQGTFIKTILADETDTLESRVALPPTADPQKFGACVTYFRRFALASLFALEAEDDDGNTAATVAPKAPINTYASARPVHKKVDTAWDGRWESYVIEIGKFKGTGKTMGQIDAEDQGWLTWLRAQRKTNPGALNPDLDNALDAWEKSKTEEHESLLLSENPF